jgi:hypothetical protein
MEGPPAGARNRPDPLSDLGRVLLGGLEGAEHQRLGLLTIDGAGRLHNPADGTKLRWR